MLKSLTYKQAMKLCLLILLTRMPQLYLGKQIPISMTTGKVIRPVHSVHVQVVKQGQWIIDMQLEHKKWKLALWKAQKWGGQGAKRYLALHGGTGALGEDTCLCQLESGPLQEGSAWQPLWETYIVPMGMKNLEDYCIQRGGISQDTEEQRERKSEPWCSSQALLVPRLLSSASGASFASLFLMISRRLHSKLR